MVTYSYRKGEEKLSWTFELYKTDVIKVFKKEVGLRNTMRPNETCVCFTSR